MTIVKSVEQAYEILGSDVVRFVNGRAWDSAGAKYGILATMVSSEWWLSHEGRIENSGGAPSSMAESKLKSAAVRFLRDDLLRTTKQRIWGLVFTLHPDGKFNLQYDYNRPEDYEETDETIDVSLSDFAEKIKKQDGT